MSQSPLESAARFEGGAFHESFPKGKSSGTLTIESDLLRFATDDGVEVVFPLETIELGSGGAADRLVFFQSPSQPEWSIFTHERKILKRPELQRLTNTGDQVRGIHRKRWLARAFTLGVLGLLLLCVCLTWLLKDPMVAFAASKIPLAVEEKIGETAFAQHTMGRDLLDSDEMKAAVDELVAPLLAVVDDAGYTFKVHVMDDPTVNAFALPGGITVLHTGLILKAEKPEEILGVMAHEMAHVTEQHSTRGLIQAAGTTLILSAVLGDVGGLAGVLINNSSLLLRMSFSREKEREADEVGMNFLVEAGIDPQGAVTFLRRLKDLEEEAKKDGGMDLSIPGMEMLSTHPATDERIEELQEAIDGLRNRSFRDFDFDLEDFQKMVRKELE